MDLPVQVFVLAALASLAASGCVLWYAARLRELEEGIDDRRRRRFLESRRSSRVFDLALEARRSDAPGQPGKLVLRYACLSPTAEWLASLQCSASSASDPRRRLFGWRTEVERVVRPYDQWEHDLTSPLIQAAARSRRSSDGRLEALVQIELSGHMGGRSWVVMRGIEVSIGPDGVMPRDVPSPPIRPTATGYRPSPSGHSQGTRSRVRSRTSRVRPRPRRG